MKKGFTLIELLVVVLIIGILSSIALPQYMKAVEKARATEAIQLLGDIARAERIYQMATGKYTRQLDILDVEIPGITNSNWIAQTKNFKFTVATPANNTDSDTFLVQALRTDANGNAMTTENQKYAIMLHLASNGTQTRWCGEQAVNAVPGSFTTSSAICKAIANNSTGEIK